MTTPNFSCTYQHYYLNSVKGKKSGNITLFNNPTQGNGILTQYTVNEIQMDYSFYNVREPYNRFKIIIKDSIPNSTAFKKTVVIPPGNYAIDELYDKIRELMNLEIAQTGWLCTKLELQPNSNKCIMQFTTNGDHSGLVLEYPLFQLSYGRGESDGLEGYTDPLPPQEFESFYSIMLWGFGRQVPALSNKNLLSQDYVSVYDSLSDETTLTYISPTIPQAGFDCYVYLVSQYMNDFDTSIYEDTTNTAAGVDLDISGANISDIWIKIPVSYYNFGDRVWYWPRTPYTFSPKASNQLIDIKVVDQFNRTIDLNNGNYNMHLVFYESRETNFI